MANTNNLTKDAEYFIYRAFGKLKKIRSGDTLETEEVYGALETIQDMMRGWQNGDRPTFKKTGLSITLTAGKGMYELNTLARVRDVHHARIVASNGMEVQLTPMNGDEYLSMPAKDTTGMPSQYWFDRSPYSHLPSETATDTSPDAAKIYLWPKADASLVSMSAKLHMRVSVPYLIPTALEDVLDIPQEWYDAFIYCLAAELYSEYGGNSDVIPLSREKWEAVREADRPSYIDIISGNRYG